MQNATKTRGPAYPYSTPDDPFRINLTLTPSPEEVRAWKEWCEKQQTLLDAKMARFEALRSACFDTVPRNDAVIRLYKYLLANGDVTCEVIERHIGLYDGLIDFAHKFASAVCHPGVRAVCAEFYKKGVSDEEALLFDNIEKFKKLHHAALVSSSWTIDDIVQLYRHLLDNSGVTAWVKETSPDMYDGIMARARQYAEPNMYVRSVYTVCAEFYKQECPSEEALPAAQSAVDYSKMRVVDLRVLLKERGLPVAGRKADLVVRLEA